ncbi:MAG TPA: hypothetical protein VGX03_29230 [Candidatus Binatia bacterium]|nr:hypothetical protein [Candidatus Binatia bacterium]
MNTLYTATGPASVIPDRGMALASFAQLPACVSGLEAGGGAHDGARELGKLGHDVRLRAVARIQP